jgi:hypothetical protein
MLLFDIVVPPVLLIPVFEVVVVVVELVVVFALPVLVLSAAQPVQNAATASKAKRAKVLRIEFSPVTLTGVSLLRVARVPFTLPAAATTRPMFAPLTLLSAFGSKAN